MAIVITEKIESREFSYGYGAQGSRARFVFTAYTDGESETDVYEYAANATPIIFYGMVRGLITVKPIGANLYEVEVPYAPANAGREGTESPPEPQIVPQEAERYFVQRRITVAEETTQIYVGKTKLIVTKDDILPVPPNQDPYNGLIGVSGEDVQGTEIIIPKITMSETWKARTTSVTPSYIRTVAWLTGRVNDSTFRGFAAGEVLFAGAEFNRISPLEYEITYNFYISLNESDFRPADGFPIVPIKYGWDYMWVEYEGDFDAAINVPVKKPLRFFITGVYYSGNFAALNIGTEWDIP